METQSNVQAIINLIVNNKDEIVKIWFGKALLNEEDPYINEIVQNGYNTLRMVALYLEDPKKVNISLLAEKIAQERVDANVNIGDFVYNIHIGRKLLFEFIETSNLSKETQVEAIIKITQIFDNFVNEAVKTYTTIKDEILQNKTRFINEMHNDRLTILGQVAASFAHEFRNPLTSIKGFINLLESDFEQNDEATHYFTIINNEMDSLQEKVNQFLYLSKMRILDDQMEEMNLSKILKEMIDFLYPRFTDENIAVSKQIEENIIICGVKDQMKQVLLNILHNAVEELHAIDNNRIIEVNLSKQNDKVILIISNNGPQIPTHLLESIFEPFISTKKLGTGLGLSVCKQIIEKHHAAITVQSTPKKTSFIISFSNNCKAI